MVNLPIIARRELHAYFLSPIAYVVLTGFALAHGIAFAAQMDQMVDLDLLTQWVFLVPLWLLVLAVPVLTMRLLSEETSTGTIETLMTAPVTEAEVVLGKFTGVLLFSMVMFLPLVAELAFLSLLGQLDVGRILAAFLGLFLLLSLFISVGILCSALTRIQVAAAIVSFVVLLGLDLVQFVTSRVPSGIGNVLRYLAPTSHYWDFTKGIVDTQHLAYFAISTALFLFLAVKAVELRKWR